MIFIALGANLPSQHGSPSDTIDKAIEVLQNKTIRLVQSSRTWITAPVPFNPDQDWYHNSVIQVETDLSPLDLLETMLNIEEEFGRVRSIKNAPRVLDLDLIAYHDEIIKQGEKLIVPHPRMHERFFVLKPLEDICEDWVHPQLNFNVSQMIENCDPSQQAQPLNRDNQDA